MITSLPTTRLGDNRDSRAELIEALDGGCGLSGRIPERYM